ncbi:MAG: hypothetical protein HY072_04790 [Deltaproteobacteria bacterium]|nr:hypothetical protein [Deltaproteobacteria bacterium]
MLIQLEDLPKFLESDKSAAEGCIVDTNLLFAASFPLDTYNEWAEGVFKTLHSLNIPIFTNLNVRSEFIELNRRVLIPEGLVDMYNDLAGNLTLELEQQLKSLKTLKQKAANGNRTFKFNDSDIKKYRRLLTKFIHTSGSNGWDLFCRDYFCPYIKDVWNDVIGELKIQFLGTREIESGEFFTSRPEWKDMVDVVGRTGIGSSDAMIVNMFLKSKFSLIVTTDYDVESAVHKIGENKHHVLAPPSMVINL